MLSLLALLVQVQILMPLTSRTAMPVAGEAEAERGEAEGGGGGRAGGDATPAAGAASCPAAHEGTKDWSVVTHLLHDDDSGENTFYTFFCF